MKTSLSRLKNLLLDKPFFQVIIFLGIEWLAFHKIFSFWFFHGWEASWLIGNTNGVFTLKTLMQSHGFISALNLLIFGWNPQGWFATAFLLHFLVTIAVFFTVRKMTKNFLIAFCTGLLFVATTADHDVITWGSFESLYAAQTLGFYLTIFFYLQWKQTKKQLFYILSLIIFSISIVLRESGLLFIPLLFLFEIMFYQKNLIKELQKKKINKKSLVNLLKIMIPFWVLGIIYLGLRASYGGSPYDYIDQRVQLRILLMHEHRYFEYIWYGILAFGQYIPPYLLPYPLLNDMKAIIYAHFPHRVINDYFFVSVGWVGYILFAFVLWLQRKSKLSIYLLFLFIIFSLITLFYSVAWTTDETFLRLPYSWSENRWRYFAFTALAPFFVISFYNLMIFLRKKHVSFIFSGLFVGFIAASVIGNIYFLNTIENQMYWENHYPSIRFYNTLTKSFPYLNSNSRFYYYRNSGYSLNDFLAEFYYIKQRFYPSMKTLPTDWVRSQMYYIVKYLSNGTLPVSNFYFLDYAASAGVINKTSDVLNLFKNQKGIDLTSSLSLKKNGLYQTTVHTQTPVEFPSLVKISLSLSPSNLSNPSTSSATFSDKKVSILSSFMKDEGDFVANTKVTVCKTMDNQINEEFHNYTYKNLTDGNIQDRSHWWADCRPAWAIFDLGEKKEISGFAWGSYNAIDYVPRDYEYQVSDDGISWKTVKTVMANDAMSRMDKLSTPVTTRYIRFLVNETVKRGMLALNEFTIIPQDDAGIFAYYHDQTSLFTDMYNFWSNITSDQFSTMKDNTNLVAWIPFNWETKPDNQVDIVQRTYYVPVMLDGNQHEYSFELPESELYSGQGQFLKRFVSSLSLQVPFDEDGVNISSLSLVPEFPSH